MRNRFRTRDLRLLTILGTLLFASGFLSLPSRAQPSTSINIVNNSNREVRYVYTSHVDLDDWSADQLKSTPISTGQSATVNNIVCDQQQLKVIVEDQDGCFRSQIISCGENASWTITNDTPVDCGS